ncbi:MAG: DUF1566 domain-containing protein, partial [Deltaproteobacteria bacterium]|nr:DUF1566 domain-containing protein [Deltaproteobacteria bacterium]
AQLLVDRRRVAHGLSDPFPARALLGQVLAAAAWLRELELVYVVTARPHGRGQAGTRVQLRGVDPMGAGDAPVQVAWTAPLQAGTVYLHPPGAQRWTALPLLQVSGAAVAVMDGVDVRGRPLYVDVRTGAPVPTVQEAQGACPPPARPAHPRASGATWQQRDGTPPPRRRVRVSETARPDEDDADTTPVKVERFTCAPGLVRDNRSGLTWQREVTSERMTLAQARDYAEALAFAGGGWRLPTREELLGIVDLARREPAVDGVAFPGTPCTGFWAEDPAGGMPWVVYFATGAANSGVETDGWCVRCVREDGAGR